MANKFFSLRPSKIDQAMEFSIDNVNYGIYLTLCWLVPGILTTLPFSVGYKYVSVFFVIDRLIYLITIIVGFSYLFHIDKKNQLLAAKYYICNYPIFYFICYLMIKPIPFIYIIVVYIINSGIAGYKDCVIKTYIDSNFIYYSEIITNAILHMIVFYIIYRRYRKFKLAQTIT